MILDIQVCILILNVAVATFNIVALITNRVADIKFIKDKVQSHSSHCDELYSKMDVLSQRVAKIEGRLGRDANGRFVKRS